MYFVILNGLKNFNKNELSYCKSECNSKIENGKLKCDCGGDVKIFEWCWKNENNSVNLLLDSFDLEVTFHPVYSSGTAVVRGSKPFLQNIHYYWEIKMISNLYGTDVMVGVGSDKTANCTFRFCSMLGLDDQSWGYSYNGIIHHNKLTRKYGKRFGLGCIVGIHLNMCTGKLEYYLNRKPQGVAFDGLKNKVLYPMACSTAAQSAMKLNCAVSQEETLQMLCLKCVQQHPNLYNKYRTIPGLYKHYDRKYFWMVPAEDVQEINKEKEDEDLHLMAIRSSSSKNRRKKRFPEFLWNKPHKKMTTDKICTESQSITHFVSEPSSSSVADIYTDNQDMESKEVCKLLYEYLSDSDADSFNDSDSANSDGIIPLIPIENDSDSS